MDAAAQHIEALLTGDRRARDAAAAALRELHFEVERLVPVLEHPHVSRQIKAIEVLRRFRSRDAVELLVPMLASATWLVADKAASALGRVGHAAPELVASALDTATTPDHRLHILDALSRLGHPRGREVLEIAADDWEPYRRRVALECIRRYRETPSVATIVAALGDPEVRATAIDVAGRVRDPAFLAPLVAIWLDEPDPPLDVKYAIAKFGTAALAPLCARAGEPPLRTRIADALHWCLFNGEVRTRIWELWQRDEPAVRDACLELLGSGYARELAGPPRARALAEHVRDPDVRRRLWCVRGYDQLARLPGADGDTAIDMLALLANDPDERVRGRAYGAYRERLNAPRTNT